MGGTPVATVSTHKLLSVEEWAALDEDVEGELVDGRLEEEELANVLHEMVVVSLSALLLAWARPRGGIVLGSDAKLAIGRQRGRRPDLCVFLGKVARPGLLDTLIRVPPHLLVEVVSPRPRDARRDRVEKLRDYATLGAAFYWIVDPQLRSLEVLALDADRRYVHVLDVTGGRIDRVPGCEGLVLDLDILVAGDDRGGRCQGTARSTEARRAAAPVTQAPRLRP